jgi:hypothetical protein
MRATSGDLDIPFLLFNILYNMAHTYCHVWNTNNEMQYTVYSSVHALYGSTGKDFCKQVIRIENIFLGYFINAHAAYGKYLNVITSKLLW